MRDSGGPTETRRAARSLGTCPQRGLVSQADFSFDGPLCPAEISLFGMAIGLFNRAVQDITVAFSRDRLALLQTLRRNGVAASDVEDALQDTFLTAHRRISEGVSVAHATAWLHGIALNVARNRARTARRSRVESVQDVPDAADPSMDGLEVVGETYRRALGHLADEHAAVLILSESEGWDMKQVAGVLSCSLATAYRYLAAAQKELADSGMADEAR